MERHRQRSKRIEVRCSFYGCDVLGGKLDVGRSSTCVLVFLRHLRRFPVNIYVNV
jgi:hypothetical protein